MPETGSTESEWQFDARDLDAVCAVLLSGQLAGYVIREGPTRQLTDVYVDTGSWSLYRGGYTARIRNEGGSSVCCLKTMSRAEDGLRSRRELEESVPTGGVSVLAKLPGPCGTVIRRLGGGEACRELFRIRTRRRAFVAVSGEAEIAEIDVDLTEALAMTAVRPGVTLRRVEVEARPGVALGDVRELAAALAQGASLLPAAESKFAAGLASAGLTPPGAGGSGATS